MAIANILAGFAGSLLLVQFSTSALAQDANATAARTELLLRKLESLLNKQVDTPKAVVSRAAGFRLVGTIHKKSNFTLPLRCQLNVSHQTAVNSYLESKSALVTFTGNTGRCELVLYFKWQFADDTVPVRVIVGLSVNVNGFDLQDTVTRSTQLSLPNQELPPPGALRPLSFDVDM